MGRTCPNCFGEKSFTATLCQDCYVRTALVDRMRKLGRAKKGKKAPYKYPKHRTHVPSDECKICREKLVNCNGHRLIQRRNAHAKQQQLHSSERETEAFHGKHGKGASS